MSITLLLEQALNGIQYGLMLFLLAAGLTLVFGIMDMINLAHGSLYMIGAYIAAVAVNVTGSFTLAVFVSVILTGGAGMVLELVVFRPLYRRGHLAQVLATFALILVANELVRMVWGPQQVLNTPDQLSGPINVGFGLSYPSYRLMIIAVGVLVAVLLYLMVAHTRVGMLVRAGASNPEMATVMGVNIRLLFTVIFGVGSGLSALAGVLLGPLLAVQVGMGENILILAFVVIVVGGIGSIRGALIGSILVGLVDTGGRAFLPALLRGLFSPSFASAIGPALASILIYVLMAAVLFWRPQGLFPARG